MLSAANANRAQAMILAICAMLAASCPGHAQTLDADRNVLTFADSVEPHLEAVAQVVVYSRAHRDAKFGAPQSTGSAAVIDQRAGVLVTNAHVVEGGDAFEVVFSDGRQSAAKLLGKDLATDLAVLQVTLPELSELAFGNSVSLRVGDIVFAVGYPLGLDQTVSLGIISGLGRASSESGVQNYIQTDAAINTGNSGGPLLDSAGRLVGVNTSILSPTEGNVGIAFAVPAEIVREIAAQIVQFGRAIRGTTGLAARDVHASEYEQFGLKAPQGVVVIHIDQGGPADRAGLQVNDVIVQADDQPVRGSAPLKSVLGVSRPGATLELVVIRSGRRSHVRLTLGDPLPAHVALGPDHQFITAFGARLQAHDPSLRIPPGFDGPMVTELEAGGIAERSGLRVFDIVVLVNGDRIQTPKQMADSIVRSTAPWSVGVIRPGVNAVIPLTIAE